MRREEWLQRFKEIVRQQEASINLAEAALVIAGDEYPDLQVGRYLQRLDQMAEEIRPRLRSARTPLEHIQRLNQSLYEEWHFQGNAEFYYDPRNSYLNDVINRRVGLPITLSVLYIELGRRLGMPLYGVGLPGHFVCKWQDAVDEIIIDPFDKGQTLDERGILRLIQDTLQRRVPLQRDWLEPVGPCFILTRILNNLKLIFVQTQKYERALWVTEKLLALEPRSDENLRDAGLLAFRAGAYRRAADSLEKYLLTHPEGPEAQNVRVYLRSVWSTLARMN